MIWIDLNVLLWPSIMYAHRLKQMHRKMAPLIYIKAPKSVPESFIRLTVL